MTRFRISCPSLSALSPNPFVNLIFKQLCCRPCPPRAAHVLPTSALLVFLCCSFRGARDWPNLAATLLHIIFSKLRLFTHHPPRCRHCCATHFRFVHGFTNSRNQTGATCDGETRNVFFLGCPIILNNIPTTISSRPK